MIASALMSFLETVTLKRPDTKEKQNSPTSDAPSESATQRLQSLTAWLASRDTTPEDSEAASAPAPAAESVESSVYQLLKQQEARKGKPRTRKSSANTG